MPLVAGILCADTFDSYDDDGERRELLPAHLPLLRSAAFVMGIFRKRALYFRKRAPYIVKKALSSAQEPRTFAKEHPAYLSLCCVLNNYSPQNSPFDMDSASQEPCNSAKKSCITSKTTLLSQKSFVHLQKSTLRICRSAAFLSTVLRRRAPMIWIPLRKSMANQQKSFFVFLQEKRVYLQKIYVYIYIYIYVYIYI